MLFDISKNVEILKSLLQYLDVANIDIGKMICKFNKLYFLNILLLLIIVNFVALVCAVEDGFWTAVDL